MPKDYKIYDGTDWVSPCDKEIRLRTPSGTWEWIDAKNKDVHYFDGINWKPMTCDCLCEPGYTLNILTNECEKFETPEFVGTHVTLVKGPVKTSYGNSGLWVYKAIGSITAPTIPLPVVTTGSNDSSSYSVNDSSGTAVPVLNSNIQSVLWGNNTDTAGRLNNIGTWDKLTADIVMHTLSFTFCLNIAESKEYLIGIAGDNYVKLDIDLNSTGTFTPVVNFTNPSNPTRNFRRWHVFPITLPAGSHKIKLTGLNGDDIGCFGAEIYDIDLATFQSTLANSSVTITDLQPKILFSTEQFIGVTIVEDGTLVGTYTCPEGTTYDSCRGVPTCVRLGTCI